MSSITTQFSDADIVQAFRADLYSAFGAHFELWIKEDVWTPATGGAAGLSTPAEENLAPHLISALDDALTNGDKPRTAQQPNGRWLLAIALPYASGDDVVATATFSTDRPDLLERTARLVSDAFEQSQRLLQCRRLLDSYASNMTKNLEELAYLCACAEHLDLATNSPDVWQIASSVLPRLRETVHAAAVVLLPMENEDGEMSDHAERRTALWAGDCGASDDTCRTLVRQFASEGDALPVVRNYFADSHETKILRHIHSFVLTPVVKGGFSLGWLLALNRIQAKGDDPSYLHRAHAGLSDLEFGTVEAHLLQFTASLLAAHGRNAALLRGALAD